MRDYRSDRSPSPEGQGKAKAAVGKAWKAYANAVNKAAEPVVEPLSKSIGKFVGVDVLGPDLIGFWVLWQLEGGFDGLLRLGMSRSSIYRRVSMFRRLTGQHPDEFRLAGVEFHRKEYIEEAAKRADGDLTSP